MPEMRVQIQLTDDESDPPADFDLELVTDSDFVNEFHQQFLDGNVLFFNNDPIEWFTYAQTYSGPQIAIIASATHLRNNNN